MQSGIELTIGQTPTSLECDGCGHGATFHKRQETAEDAEGLRQAKADAEAKENASVRGMFKQAVKKRASRIFGKKS
jgi:hypothetical protein